MTSKVLLLGMMGSGKTSVGTALAARLGWPYVDNDVLLASSSGLTAPELLAARGSQALRSAESAVLTQLLGLPGPVVGGVPGGVVLEEHDRARLRSAGCLVIWLRCSPVVLARRVGTGDGRPRLGDDPAAALTALAAVRDPLFAQVATYVVDVDSSPPAAVARHIAELVTPEPVVGPPQ